MAELRILLLGLLFCAACLNWAAAETLRDPLRPELGRPGTGDVGTGKPRDAGEPDWQLTAVIISATRRVAVINGRSLQLGDRISGYRVSAIEANHVVLVKKGRSRVVPRVASGLKKTPPGITAEQKGYAQ